MTVVGFAILFFVVHSWFESVTTYTNTLLDRARFKAKIIFIKKKKHPVILEITGSNPKREEWKRFWRNRVGKGNFNTKIKLE